MDARAKTLLAVELGSLTLLVSALFVAMFLNSYTFHFEQLTLNFYTNGKVDFTTDASSLVRTLGTVAFLTLFFGITVGAAIGLTYSLHAKATRPGQTNYEEDVAKMGFVVITKTEQGTTYQLTDLGRQFLKEYRFLDKTEQVLT